MIKIKTTPSAKYRSSNLSVGTTFHGRVGGYVGYFLKAFEVLVYLNDPVKTWSLTNQSIDIEDYREVNLKLEED